MKILNEKVKVEVLKILCHYKSYRHFLGHKTTLNELSNKEYKIFVSIEVSKKDKDLCITEKSNSKNIKFILIENKISIKIISFLDKRYKNRKNINKKFSLFFVIFTFIFEFISLLITKIISRKIIKKISPDILLLGADRDVGVTSTFIKYSNKNNIKVITYMLVWNAINFCLVNRKNDSLNIFENVSDPILLKFKKDATFKDDGKTYSYLKYPKYLAADILNMLTYNPFILGSNSDFIWVDTEDLRDNLVLYGIDKKKIRITGNSDTDVMKKFKKKVSASKKNMLQIPKILIGMPHLYEHNFCSEAEHIDDIDSIFREIKNLDAIIYLSIHPSIKLSTQEYIIENAPPNSTVINKSFTEYLHTVNVYISWWSTTIHLAVHSNINTIVLNHYGLTEYGCENLIDKVNIVNNIKELNQIISNVLETKTENIKNYFAEESSIKLIQNELLKIQNI